MGKAEEFFKKLAGAQKAGAGGSYLVHGNYENLEVKHIEMKESDNPETKGKMFFIVEFEVDTFVGGKYVDAAGKQQDTTGTYSKGSRASTAINLEDPYGMGMPKAKELAANILAAKHNTPYQEVWEGIDESDLAALCGPEQPGTGAKLKCAAQHIITKKTKKDFTVCVFEPMVAKAKAA